VTINWTAGQSGGVNDKTYTIYRNTVNNSGTAVAMGPTAINALSYVDNPGTGTFFYWVQTNSAGLTSPNRVASVPASVTVSACAGVPSIQLSTAAMIFAGVSGGSPPAGQTFTVTNNGAPLSTLKWHATTECSWVQVNVTGSNGTYFNGADLGQSAVSPNLNVTVSIPSNTGSPTCRVAVSDNGSSPAAANSPSYITVTYNVQPSNPSGVIAGITAACPAAQTVTINWTAGQSGGVNDKTYTIYRNTVNNSGTAVAMGPTAINALSYVDNPGTGTFFYWVQTNSAGLTSPNRVASVPASVTVSACLTPPSISLSTLDPVAAQVGSPPPSFQSLTITNGGQTNLSWSGTNNTPSICTLRTASGTANANNGSDVVLVDFVIPIVSMIATSPNPCSVTISDTSGQATSKTAATTYTVINPPVKAHIILNPTSMSFPGVAGGSTPPGQTLNIQNSGGTVLNWTATTPYAGKPGTYCHISSLSGTIAGGANQNVFITVDSPISAGLSNNCGVQISDVNADNSPKELTVSYNVTSGSCPAGITVNTSPAVAVGVTSAAYPSDPGFTGGAMVSSDPTVASVAGVSGSYTITGHIPGSVTISGTGWFYVPNGAINCSFSGSGTSILVGSGSSPPGLVSIDNTACGQMLITWSPVSGATGYNIYRSTTPFVPGIPITATPFAPQGGNLVNQTYPDAPAAGLYYYWVSAINASGAESAKQWPNSGSSNPGSINACSIANLGNSDKDIVAVNDNAAAGKSNACNSSTDALPSTTVLNAGDKLKFQINLCNEFGTGTANGIRVSDTMINLVTVPVTGWNANYCIGVICTAVTPTVAGTAPNQTLNFDLTNNLFNIPASGGSSLTFEALLKSPGTTGSIARFQNCFNIGYNVSLQVNRCTPLLPFNIGTGVPIIKEVP
jgi:hypothetical protein